MSRFLVTPSLYSSWSYYRNSETATKDDFLKVLRKEKEPPNENMLTGIRLEEDIVACSLRKAVPADLLLPGREPEWIECCTRIAAFVEGGLFQEKVYREYGVGPYDVFLYGKVDVIKQQFAYDIKYSKSYEIGKYNDSIQHDLYMFCANLPRFAYLISDGRNVYQEDYARSVASEKLMFTRIFEMLNDIFADQDFAHAYDAFWTSLTKAA